MAVRRHVLLAQEDEQMLTDITVHLWKKQLRTGALNKSEVVRRLIRQEHKKIFPELND